MQHWFQKYFPGWFPIERVNTPYNKLEVVRQKNKLVLNAFHTNYSFGSLHEVFKQAFQQSDIDYQSINNVLILGFGAGSVAWILQKEKGCPCSLTGVEIDKEVIALAKKYFRLDELKKLQIHIDDAMNFLLKDKTRYDLIIADLFLDHRTPDKFLTPAFLENLHAHLRLNGTVFFNYLKYDFEAKKKAGFMEKEFRKIFQLVKLLTFRKEPKNIVFTGKNKSGNHHENPKKFR